MFGLTTEQLFGVNTYHVPFNFISQGNCKGNKYSGVWQANHPGFEGFISHEVYPHVLVMGDAIIRPRMILGSKHLIGTGIGGVYSHGFDPDAWVKEGKLLFERK